MPTPMPMSSTSS